MPPQWWWLMEKSRRQLWQREPARWSVIMTKRTAADNYAPIVIIFSLSSPPSYPLKSRLMVMLMTPTMMICLIYMGDKTCCCIFPGTLLQANSEENHLKLKQMAFYIFSRNCDKLGQTLASFLIIESVQMVKCLTIEYHFPISNIDNIDINILTLTYWQ